MIFCVLPLGSALAHTPALLLAFLLPFLLHLLFISLCAPSSVPSSFKLHFSSGLSLSLMSFVRPSLTSPHTGSCSFSVSVTLYSFGYETVFIDGELWCPAWHIKHSWWPVWVITKGNGPDRKTGTIQVWSHFLNIQCPRGRWEQRSMMERLWALKWKRLM